MFEPARLSGPSGLADPPRPFVFRAHHLDGCLIRPGEPFHVDVHIFDTADPALAYFTLAFAQLASEGLGPRRGRVELTAVHSLDVEKRSGVELFQAGACRLSTPPAPIAISLMPTADAVGEVAVCFETPTELKGVPILDDGLPFGALFARVRDRISTLRLLYGPGPLGIDFKALASRAAAVRCVRAELRSIPVSRRSSRTGQEHGIGGFVGTVQYEGDLREFVRYLEAAAWTGVGRHTVFGSGVIKVTQ